MPRDSGINESVQKMSTLQNKRSGHLARVTRTHNTVADILSKNIANISLMEISKLESAKDICAEQEEKIKALDQEILDSLAGEEDLTKMETECIRIDENRLKVTSIIKALTKVIDRCEEASSREEISDTEQQTSSQRNSGLKLPKLSLTTFSGKYEEWTPFFDLFQGAVAQNCSLTDIQKLHYLRSSLKGEPAKLLAHLPTTNANYSVAMQMLQERYGNKRVICQAHLKALFHFTPIKTESVDQLRKLLSCYIENVMALQALGVDTNSCDVIWVYTLAEKLDPETRKHWELASPDDPQTMEQMKKFLDERIRALEASKQPRSSSSRDQQSTLSESTTQSYQGNTKSMKPSSCSLCNDNHSLNQCDQFKSKNVEERRTFARDKRMFQLPSFRSYC